MTTETMYLIIIIIMMVLLFREVILTLGLIIMFLPVLPFLFLVKWLKRGNNSNETKESNENIFNFQDGNENFTFTQTFTQNGNGNNFQSKGNNISIINGRVWVDGKEITK